MIIIIIKIIVTIIKIRYIWILEVNDLLKGSYGLKHQQSRKWYAVDLKLVM